ncbi:cytosolic phospholipase A2 gamma-like [Halichoeres trimaculatus]|uniref:cytosolic phospholipase A2 gamma-like n=1 Tax=Halichoeres trimaculatus TaxID=147232 RepID=UPI003D9EBFA4
MEGEKAAPENSVHEYRDLCAGERDFVDQRKKKVLESFRKRNADCAEDSVPHIALLGSGGGQRAAVGLLGSLSQMEKDDLLDSVLYLGGVSGSTWSMAFLYTDPEWSMKVDEVIENLMKPEVNVLEAVSWLNERYHEEDFSFSDIWGLFIATVIMKQMELGKLSDPVNRNPNNPYPIYCATEDNCRKNGPIEGKWFEVTPHEAGFTELGLFVETRLLGSKFQNGELMEEKREMDMVKLQGILGAAFADTEVVREYFSDDWKTALEVFFATVETLTTFLSPKKFEWKWGTTNNFCYEYKDSNGPLRNLTSLENINLVDAGLLMNIPFPSFLGDKRDIDLIIALEFTEGDTFQTLNLARDYATKLGKPFPVTDKDKLGEEALPLGHYVFEGTEKEPTVVYLPLFNQDNCETREEYNDRMDKFTTVQVPYTKEQTDELLEIAKGNIWKNKGVLLEQINKAAVRRRERRQNE